MSKQSDLVNIAQGDTITVDHATGRVGIGTSSPQAKLQVLDTLKVSTADQSSGSVILGDGGSTAFNVGIARWNGATNATGAGGVGYFAQGSINAGGHFFYTGDAAAGSTTERMRIDSSGNVGIGTSSPAATFGSRVLQVAGTADANSEIRLTHTTSGTGSADGFTMLLTGSDGYLYNRENGSLILGTNNTERMRIDSTGDVFLNASKKLQFGANGTTSIGSVIGEHKFLGYSSGGNDWGAMIRAYIPSGSPGIDFGDLRFYTSGGGSNPLAERMRIDSSGNVGIGISSPTACLHVNAVATAALLSSTAVSGGTAVPLKIYANASAAATARIDFGSAANVSSHSFISAQTLTASASNLVFGSSGAERMRIDSSGNVGIGTSSPSAKLHVSGGNIVVQDGIPEIGLYSPDGSSNQYFIGANISDTVNGGFRIGSGASLISGTTHLTVTSSGNVGIGTSSPARKLHVATAGNNYIVSHNTTGSSALLLGAESASTSIYSWTSPTSGAGVPLKFFTGATESVRIDSSGNVGIGTTLPQNRVTISGATPYLSLLNTTAGTTASPSFGGIKFYGFSETANGLVASVDGGNTQNNNFGGILRFSTQADGGGGLVEHMHITSSGNVGIGTSSPAQKLHVAGNILMNNSGELRFIDSGGTKRTAVSLVGNDLNVGTSAGGNLKFYNGSSYTERMRIDSSGQILIGCTGIFGTTGNQGVRPGSAGQLILGANSGELYHQVPGNIYYLVSTTGGNTSDVNLKTNVATLEGALDKVCAIRGVSFEFIEEQMSDPDKGQQIGVIAQEVEAQYPEAVVTGPDGIKSVRYEKLVAPLIEAIKEQRAVIEALEARMAVLET